MQSILFTILLIILFFVWVNHKDNKSKEELERLLQEEIKERKSKFEAWVNTSKAKTVAALPAPRRGFVIFYDTAKEFGFVADAYGNQFYLNAKSIVENVPLEAGQFVYLFAEDKPVTVKKKPLALEVYRDPDRLNQRHISAKKKASSFVICQHCSHKMIPRAVFYRGQCTRTVCPFCGTTYNSDAIEYCEL